MKIKRMMPRSRNSSAADFQCLDIGFGSALEDAAAAVQAMQVAAGRHFKVDEIDVFQRVARVAQRRIRSTGIFWNKLDQASFE